MSEWVVLISMRKLYTMRVRAKMHKEGECRKPYWLPPFLSSWLFLYIIKVELSAPLNRSICFTINKR